MYRHLTGRRGFRVGDIVLYTNPGAGGGMNNLITQVMDISPSNRTVIIRGHGNSPNGSTTVVVFSSRLTLLPVDKNSALQVPGTPLVEQPFEGVVSGRIYNNRAVWKMIPLDWFQYQIRVQ